MIYMTIVKVTMFLIYILHKNEKKINLYQQIFSIFFGKNAINSTTEAILPLCELYYTTQM